MTYRRFTPRKQASSAAAFATLLQSDRPASPNVATVAAKHSSRPQSVAGIATVAGTPPEHMNEVEERAALIEYGADVPRAWAEGFARLHCASPAVGFSDDRWRRLIDDGGLFLDRWGNEAAAIGWNVADVFGVDPTTPAARFDRMGILSLIDGGAVVALDSTSVTIETRSGGTLRYRRTVLSGSVPIWQVVP
jgi:hypothetical protein